MKLIVDQSARLARMRAHTATHLLHAQLAEIFPSTQQAGSLVDTDLVRFDFQAPRALTHEEISAINETINDLINQAYPVSIEEMSYQQAIQTGAKAFFEDKYGDVVRVVHIHDSDHSLSIELCGGTHVANTSEIGSFVIISQESVASGIRRITAYTGPRVMQYVTSLQQKEQTLAQLADCTPAQLVEKITKLTQEHVEFAQRVESMQSRLLAVSLQQATRQKNSHIEHLCIDADNFLQQCSIKEIVQVIKQIQPEREALIRSTSGGFAIVSPSGKAKTIATDLGLKGGGSDTLVQGKDEEIGGKIG